jgi:ABC-2 type transport system permease protein
MSSIVREAWFLLRDRAAHVWVTIAFAAASLAVVFGLNEVTAQHETIERLKVADKIEQAVALENHRDWGSAAYYTFHLTYDEPSEFAFAALGQRDASPWKHRVRMLALEGQIYETDAANPDFALIGRFDFAFVIAMIAPLLLILLLHDLRAVERANGRFELISVTSATGTGIWFTRAALRVAALALALLIPLWIGGVMSGAGIGPLLLASLVTLLHLGFWWAVTAWLNTKGWTAPVNLTALMGIWLALAIVAPAAMQKGIDAAVTIPDGGDIILTQREAVNDAWDLPVSATMEPFLERHPEWEDYTEMESTFEWKWYYAFQQVGDQTAEPLSLAYRAGRDQRDALSAALSWLSPPAKVERVFQSLARTDTKAAADYEASVRAYHANLRGYYYPGLFRDDPFTDEAVEKRPDFEPL